jgi:cytochrome c-type biogenesis protein CcmH
MTTLYIGSTILVLIGIVFSLWPYINYRLFNRIDATVEITEREAVNVSLYRDHLADLDTSLKMGSIDKDQYVQLKNELERNLIEDSSVNRINSTSTEVDTDNKNASSRDDGKALASKSVEKKSTSRLHIPIFLGIVLLLPIASISLYQYLGNADAVVLTEKLARQAQLQEQLSSSNNPEKLRAELQRLDREIVDGLKRRSTNGEIDLDTRVLLARNAVTIGDYDTAINNFQVVLEAQPQSAQIMVELAQAIFIKANNNAVPVVGVLAERALSIQPNNVMGLGLLGITRFQAGDYRQAIDTWERAIGIYPPGSQNSLSLQNGIEQARLRLAVNTGDITADSGKQETNTIDSEAAATKLIVNVSLGDNVLFKPDHTVFVYARAWQGAKLPLAIKRVLASQLPISVELDDTMAMAPQFNLSSAETVQLVARISATGNAIATEGDWEVRSGPIQLKSSTAIEHTLEISKPFSAAN